MFACIHASEIPEALYLTEFAYGFSPIVEEVRYGTVVIEVEGCELLFGSRYQLANEVAQRAQKARTHGGLETTASVAIAAEAKAVVCITAVTGSLTALTRIISASAWHQPADHCACD